MESQAAVHRRGSLTPHASAARTLLWSRPDAYPGQITKVYEAETRRRWSEEEKLAIVEESKAAPVSRVAKKYGVAVSLLFRWRKLQGIGVRRRGCPPSNGFVRLALPAPTDAGGSHCGHGAIEIVLSGGRRVIVGKDVDTVALLRIVDALERR